MEFWDILDENRKLTGRTVERGKPMKHGEYHLVVHVWVKNSKGEFLISKRTPNKTYPNMWETTGGSAIVGDDSLQAALREVKEEIGIDLSSIVGERIYSLKRQKNDFSDFLDVWLFNAEVDIKDVVYQHDEVCDAKWATKNQILTMIKDKEFVDVFTYLDDLFSL